MKAQATIEFMSTYGFMFILLGIAITAVVLLTTYVNNIQDTTCTSYSNLECNFVEFYSNITNTYSIVDISLINSQTVPVNITGISATVGSVKGTGLCSPAFLYPAQETMCEIVLPNFIQSGQVAYGIFNINAGYCNSDSYSLNSTACHYNASVYGGSFDAYPSNTEITPFVVITGRLPSSIQLESEPLIPILSSNYTLLQNGDFVSYRTQNSISYAFGSNAYIGQKYFNEKVQNFPGIISSLNTQNIACSAPYNSIFSVAYSTIQMYQGNTITVNAYATNAIQIYYKGQNSNIWTAVFNGGSWNVGNGVNSYTAQPFLNAGIYQIAVAWVKTCGEGLQAVQIGNIGA